MAWIVANSHVTGFRERVDIDLNMLTRYRLGTSHVRHGLLPYLGEAFHHGAHGCCDATIPMQFVPQRFELVEIRSDISDDLVQCL